MEHLRMWIVENGDHSKKITAYIEIARTVIVETNLFYGMESKKSGAYRIRQ